VAERYLGSKHPIANTLRTSLMAAKKALAILTEKSSKGRTTTLPPLKNTKTFPGKASKRVITNMSTALSEDKADREFQTIKEEVLADNLRDTSLEDGEVWNQEEYEPIIYETPTLAPLEQEDNDDDMDGRQQSVDFDEDLEIKSDS
jgi:hypothetical protein